MATKNDDPYTESAIENEASMYSIACKAVKYNPNNTVKVKPRVVSVKFFSKIEWWAHVTVTPDLRRIIVLSSGTWNGLKIKIPWGGQNNPNSNVGFNLLWKKAQKNEKKNKTSDVINKIIPHFIPSVTFRVWNPWKVASRVISRHHWYLDRIIVIKPNIKRFIVDKWNHFTKPDVIIIAPKDAVKGQGLFSTRWNGWFIVDDIMRFFLMSK